MAMYPFSIVGVVTSVYAVPVPVPVLIPVPYGVPVPVPVPVPVRVPVGIHGDGMDVIYEEMGYEILEAIMTMMQGMEGDLTMWMCSVFQFPMYLLCGFSAPRPVRISEMSSGSRVVVETHPHPELESAYHLDLEPHLDPAPHVLHDFDDVSLVRRPRSQVRSDFSSSNMLIAPPSSPPSSPTPPGSSMEHSMDIVVTRQAHSRMGILRAYTNYFVHLTTAFDHMSDKDKETFINPISELPWFLCFVDLPNNEKEVIASIRQVDFGKGFLTVNRSPHGNKKHRDQLRPAPLYILTRRIRWFSQTFPSHADMHFLMTYPYVCSVKIMQLRCHSTPPSSSSSSA